MAIKQKFALTRFLSFGINDWMKELGVQALANQSGSRPLASAGLIFLLPIVREVIRFWQICAKGNGQDLKEIFAELLLSDHSRASIRQNPAPVTIRLHDISACLGLLLHS